MKLKNNQLLIIGIILIVLLGIFYLINYQTSKQPKPVFCPLTPGQTEPADICPLPVDTNPVQIDKPTAISSFDYKDLVKLEYPLPNDSISSPLVVRGQARGTWFFEASFPVTVVNWDGLIIGEGIAQAQSDWMTEEFVPFVATIKFETPTYKNNGALILQKDNPSGLPKYDDALEIPILFVSAPVNN
jgi:hypothetical protein